MQKKRVASQGLDVMSGKGRELMNEWYRKNPFQYPQSKNDKDASTTFGIDDPEI